MRSCVSEDLRRLARKRGRLRARKVSRSAAFDFPVSLDHWSSALAKDQKRSLVGGSACCQPLTQSCCHCRRSGWASRISRSHSVYVVQRSSQSWVSGRSPASSVARGGGVAAD